MQQGCGKLLSLLVPWRHTTSSNELIVGIIIKSKISLTCVFILIGDTIIFRYPFRDPNEARMQSDILHRTRIQQCSMMGPTKIVENERTGAVGTFDLARMQHKKLKDTSLMFQISCLQYGDVSST